MDENNSARIVAGPKNDIRNLLYTEMRRTGGDPSFLFELLETAIENRSWETLLDEDGNPVGSLRRLIEAPLPIGCGQSSEKVLKLIEVEHRYENAKPEWHDRMIRLKTEVRRQLEIEGVMDNRIRMNMMCTSA